MDDYVAMAKVMKPSSASTCEVRMCIHMYVCVFHTRCVQYIRTVCTVHTICTYAYIWVRIILLIHIDRRGEVVTTPSSTMIQRLLLLLLRYVLT